MEAQSRFDSSRLLNWAFWVAISVMVIVAVFVLIALIRYTNRGAAPGNSVAPAMPEATWASGAKLAPDFSLTDQAGRNVSIARFRGRPLIVTFIDPLCRNLCPLEARVIDSVETSLPKSDRPAVVAVSVDQWGDSRRYLVQDDVKWKLGSRWHWAVGKPAALRRVWRAYEVAVLDSTRTVAGVTVHNISHTEEAFLIDRRGYQRALYLFPFVASDVARTLRRLASA